MSDINALKTTEQGKMKKHDLGYKDTILKYGA